MATKARQQYFADENSLQKIRREFSIADDIQQKIDSIEPGAQVNKIETVKVNGTALVPDANKAVNVEVPEVIDNLYTVDSDNALSAKQGKLLYDYIQNIASRGRFLSNWNSATGLPMTNPSENPYPYKSGDYFVVSNVAGLGGTNYRPDGSSYTIGQASTVVETEDVSVSDFYFYDGTNWLLLVNTARQIAVDSSLSTTSTNPVENRVITNALNNKQDVLTAGNHIDITNNVISAEGFQEELTAGENITIGDVCHPNTQGPAPDGFHLPVDELKNVLNILTKTFSNCGFSSKMEVPENILKMPRGGRIRDDNGGINMRGDAYYYWYSKTSYYASYGGAFYATGDGFYDWHPDGGYATANGFPIRAFKDVPVQPDNTWTVIYDGSAIATGAGVFYNAIDGLISISGDGTTRYTMMDKNLGATQVYNYGDTLSDSNCGLYYQWGNNHGFPSDLTGVTTSTTLVDVTGYGPGNYYDNDVFIISTQNPWSWFNGTYENLWGKNNPTGTWCELAISATDTKYTAGTGINIDSNNVISSTATSAQWGNITGTLSNQTDLQSALDSKVNLGINKVFDNTVVEIGKWEHEPGGDSSGHHIELDPNGEVSTYNLTQAGHNEATLGSGTLELLNNTVLDGNKTATFDHEKIVADDGTNTNTYNFFGNDRIAKLSDLAGKQDVLTAGNHIDITNNVISTTGLQEELTAGENITIGDECTTESDMKGPCPSGFHVPLNTEWQAVYDIWTALGGGSSDGTNFGIALKLPFAGRRKNSSAGVDSQGTYGSYWSSTRNDNNIAYRLYFNSSDIGSQSTLSRTNGCSVRCFKNSPTVPTSSWTKLYGISIESGGIFWSSTEGLISMSSDGQTWITIADKNLGATTVWNSGDTLSEANCGKYYQRGNNYGFPRTGSVTTSSTQVDASNYGPGNYYSSDTFIKYGGRWDSGDNGNLWGGVTQGTWQECIHNVISAIDTKYTAGTGISIDANNEISIDTSVVATQTDLASKQDTLTAGTGISIDANNEISNTLPGPTIAATAPTGTEGALWYDTTNDVLMAHNGTAWKEAGTQMKVLSYGHSTWQDFLDAYNENAIVYCRASSNSNPATGNQTRMAFMAFVNSATPTEVEFQYYRSRSDHNTAANQLDQVFVYKLTSASGGTWTVTERNTGAKAVAGTGINLAFGSGNMTISADTTVLATQTDLNSKQDTISDLATIRNNASAGKSASDTIATYGDIVTHDADEFATAGQGAKADTAIQPNDNISELTNDAGYITSADIPTLDTAMSDTSTKGVQNKVIKSYVDTQVQEATSGAVSDTVYGTSWNGVTGIAPSKNVVYDKISTMDTAISGNTTNINTINSKIPSEASVANQLADKDYVGDSINSVTAYYITKNAAGDQWANRAELFAATTFYSGGEVRVPTKNDYTIVLSDEQHDNATTRYIYNNGWEYQYTVNETAMTQAQLNAINSGITAAKVSTYDGYATGKQNTLSTAQLNAVNSGITSSKVTQYDGYATSKQDKLIAGSNIQIASDGKTISATDTTYTAGNGINIDSNNEISANTTVLATKTDLNSKQDTISDLAAIRSGAGLGATAVQPGDNISDLNNDSGYITSSYHDSTKQDKLVSGTNIKTINGNGLLGGGNISIGEAHIMTQSEFDNVGSPKGIYFIYDYLYPTLYITITPNTYQAQVGDTIRFDITRGSNEAIGASTMTSSDGLNSWSSASFDGFTPYITGLTYTIKSEDVTAGKYVLTLIATETNNPSNTIEVSCVIQVNA